MIKEMASKMVDKFDRYWFVARDFLGVASVFHHKYRFVTLKFYSSKFYGNEAESEVEKIRQIFIDFYNEYKSSLPGYLWMKMKPMMMMWTLQSPPQATHLGCYAKR